jgi:hypothetical protein
MYISENTNHSALAPTLPRIDDPIYYDQEPILAADKLPPSNTDLDTLFWSEATQRGELGGVETWQVAALNRHLRFSPATGYVSGGHRPIDRAVAGLPFNFGTLNLGAPLPRSFLQFPGARAWLTAGGTNEERDFMVYQRERIKVDETRWLPFLRKDRWFDWIQVSPSSVKRSQPGRTWSVDDPNVWEILKVSIELANRMLEALIEDKHDGGTNITFFSSPVL